MRRRTDWFEPCALLGVVLVVVLAVVLALTASQAVLADRLAAVQREEADRRPVAATVLADVREPGSDSRSVAVRWGEPPDEHFAVIRLPAQARPGPTLPIWLGPDGRLAPPPATRAGATQAAGTTGATVLLGSLALVGAGYGLARWLVVRKRLAAWGEEWEWIEPRWRDRMT
ncbi:Rv1733c family protein [Saccharopolyspora taberi]